MYRPINISVARGTLRCRNRFLTQYNRVAPFSTGLPNGIEELLMPALSPTMTTGTISTWLKNVGDELKAGDVLCQIETDKAVVDYEMQDDAVLASILLPAGSTDIPVGATLAFTAEDHAVYTNLLSTGALDKLQNQSVSKVDSSLVPKSAKPSDSSNAHKRRQPLIKFLGKRSHSHAPAPASVATTPSSPPTPQSVPASNASVSSDAFTDIALSNMRKIIAKRLTESKVTVPHHYVSIDCEIDAIMKLRQNLKSLHNVKVSLNDFILKAVALALRDVPEANCFFNVATNSVQTNESVDISVAVATPTGLITPIVPRVDTIGLSGVNEKFMELVTRARENKLKPEEFQGGSFTVSNLGGFGIDNFTAVINPPQACIMAVGRGRKELLPPRDTDDENVEPRVATLLNVTLSSDRRVVDNIVAGQFLQVFKRYMEFPDLLLL